jgi:serine/threonine protein kinase
MDPSANTLHARVKALYVAVVELPPDEREAFLAARATDEAPVVERVRALLAAGGPEGEPALPGFMSAPTAGGREMSATTSLDAGRVEQRGPFAAAVEGPGTVIGPYRLLQQIGEGGFGTVFMAEQEHPVRRKVALKIIKLGMDTKQVVARFEQERQALALMDHPNIAKVLDAGATAAGRPYFVMELCRGDPITRYCDVNQLSIRERLELAGQVCRAVQHAHQKGVIHRDIKPSNVLVATEDGRPFAKVIDFGIAKATNARLTERTLFTEHRQLVGTPEYMSPEQAEGSLDIDTRTDVYSLGVLLYELLTGSTPFEGTALRSAAYAEIQRIIREVDPPAPSTRLVESKAVIATIAAQRRSEPKALGLLVRGELDWIVMKALDKDRARRYASPGELAEDLERHRHGDAVRAAPPSRLYRLRTIVRRHRIAVLAAAAVATALVIGVIGTSYGLVRAERERSAAVDRERETEIVTTFLSEMLESASPEAKGRDVPMRVVLDNAAELIGGRMTGLPIAEARLRLTMSRAYRALGEFDSADRQLGRVLEIRRKELGPEHPDTVLALGSLAGLRQEQGRYEEAERLASEALSMLPAEDDSRLSLGIRNNRAQTLERLGRLKDALDAQRDVVERMRRSLGASDMDVIGATVNLANMLARRGDAALDAEAEEALVRAVDDAKKAHGVSAPGTLFAMGQLAGLHLDLGRPRSAEPIYRDVLARQLEVLGSDHPGTARTQASLATALDMLGRSDEARSLREQAWHTMRTKLGPTHHDTIGVTVDLLTKEEELGWPEGRSAMLPGLLEDIRSVALEPRVAEETLNTCAWFLLTVEPPTLRDPAVALAAIERCVAQARANRNDGLWSYLDTLALAHARTGAMEKAVAAQREAILLLRPPHEAYRGEMEARLREYEAAVR